MKCTPTFKLKNKSKLSKFFKLRITLTLKQLERSLKWLGVASRGFWWCWGDRHVCASFKRRKNVLEMFGDEHLIKRLHVLSYSKRAKNIYITKEHHNWLQSGMMNKSLNPLFTLLASAARYRSTATGAGQPCLGKFLKRLSALHH